MKQSFNIETLGCKLNFSESDTISGILRDAGLIKREGSADIHILNTCSVTEHADNKCRKRVARIKKDNPSSRVFVIGCFAQLKPGFIRSIPGVDKVLTASEKFDLGKYLDKEVEKPETSIEEVKEFVHAHSYESRTRSFLKVQDGCNYSCSFCTIPLARGGSRSPDIPSLVNQANELGKSGVNEIVLTGVNIGDYGIELNEGAKKREHGSFLDLIRALDEVDSVSRFRISSIEPNLLSDDIIEFVANSRSFVPHFHIPMQSGSPEILRAMRRRYKRDLYADRVRKIKELMPHACIGADVIVGFPGETDVHFSETLEFVKGLPLSYLHPFTYSERPNTLATELGSSVASGQRTERRKILQDLSDKLRRNFYHQNLVGKHRILFEDADRNGWIYGFTDNYVRVKSQYDPHLANKLVVSELNGIDIDGLCLVQSENTDGIAP